MLGALRLGQPLANAQIGDAAILAIRPSDVRVAEGENGIDTHVHLIEPLGDITVLSVLAEAKGPGNREPIRLVLPEAKAAGIRTGDPMRIALDMNRVHLFRASDGAAIR